MSTPSKSDILEHIFDYMVEDDWLEGVDLYQANRVKDFQAFHSLFYAKISTFDHSNFEVRVKMHNGGQCIQWIECTCKKNRTHNVYCEHIAAMMVHIDREHPELFKNLDQKMPLKPPSPAKRTKVGRALQAKISASSSAGSRSKIIGHLQGNIHSVELIDNGPAIRVRIEIKEGQLTHYDLDIDAAAKFIQGAGNVESASAELKILECFEDSCELGTFIQSDGQEKITAERCIVIPYIKRADKNKFKSLAAECYKLQKNTEPFMIKREFIFSKVAQKYIGKQFFFFPGRGYYPIDRSKVAPEWFELPHTKTYKEDQAAMFLETEVHTYAQVGNVWVDNDIGPIDIQAAPQLSEIRISNETDGWFILDPRYQVGDTEFSMAELMQHLSKRKRRYFKKGKTWIKVPTFLQEFDWQIDETEKFIKVDALGLMRLKAASGGFDQFVGSRKLLDQIREKTEFKPAGPPPSLSHTNLDLRDYQVTGYEWLWWLYQNNLHGLIADEMGLGKTHQAMALLSAIVKPDCKFLVIAPTTVLDHWYDKIVEFSPSLKPLLYHGSRRLSSFSDFKRSHHTLVTSYGVVLRDNKQLTEIKWDAVVLDEAHYVKNSDTATYKAVCKLNARIRICLTGTPMENNLGELKNIFDFLVPGYLGSDEYFKREFIAPIVLHQDPEREHALLKLIHPFKLRRVKDNVLKDLPPKIEDKRSCSLSEDQVKLYQNILALKGKPLIDQLENEDSSVPYLHVFATLNLLKQICDHPALVIENADYEKYESGKFELLKEILSQAMGSNHKVVIYSQYLKMIDIIKKYLDSLGIANVTLTGQTRNRGKVVKEFQTNPNCKVYIGSLLAGGIGIDLTAASVVIHYDRWWNASKEAQATDRVHRIGQHSNVQVFKLITKGTLEEKIDALINQKKDLFDKFMNKDEEVFKHFTRQQIIDLLEF